MSIARQSARSKSSALIGTAARPKRAVYEHRAPKRAIQQQRAPKARALGNAARPKRAL